MHARVLTGQVQSQAIEEFERVIAEAVLPCAREQHGFRGGHGEVNRTTGRGVLVTYWASADDLVATESDGLLNTHFARVVSCLDGPAVRVSYEVEYPLDELPSETAL